MDISWIGLSLILAGGMMQGAFTIPQKFLKGWRWEMGWLMYSIAAMIILPWTMVMITIPDPVAVYSAAGTRSILLAAVFGMGWGIGSVFFGLGVAALGTALGFAIIMSLIAALGSIIPLAVQHPDQLWTSRGMLLFLGLAIVILGVALCSKAGALREAAAPRKTGNFLRGLVICILSGVLSPMFNFAVAFLDDIANLAQAQGVSAATASVTKIAVAISSGFFANAGYCLYLIRKNGGWKNEVPGATGRNLALAAAMGVLWFFGMYFYGQGAAHMGQYGAVFGWPLFMTVILLVANLLGLLTGEWRGAGARALRFLACGNAAMIAAVIVISIGSQP
jgi:L-rhamnose-H+ transport protein